LVAADTLLKEARTLTDARMGEWADALASRFGALPGPAVAYALASPGKRVRAALVLAAYRSVGGTSLAIAGVAAAVETVHTYSLVHDDLPCMDNDDLRRGRPTTHRAFDIPTATRVGFLLVPAAALVLSRAARDLSLGHGTLGHMAETLFQAGGIEGMVGGQWMDLEAEQRMLNLDELTAVHRGKTGALIRAACILGGLAGRATPTQLNGLAGFGEEIGLAFQVADDVLDVTGTSDELGKTAGRDEALQKSTFVRLMGVEGARREAARLAREAIAHLERAGIRSGSLSTLADYIVTRRS
jgi:farnesyl diphosphate synthase/geranylgeranyl diphosphate synthase type II